MPNYNTPVKLVKYTKQTLHAPERTVYLDQEKELARTLLGENATGLKDAKGGLFYTDRSGTFHVLRKGVDNDHIMSLARAACLYVRDKNNALHQISLENNEEQISIHVSVPLQDAEPKRPSHWTYIKSIFIQSARDEIQTYQKAREFNDSFRKLTEQEKDHIDPKPDMTAIRPEDAVPSKAAAPSVGGKGK